MKGALSFTLILLFLLFQNATADPRGGPRSVSPHADTSHAAAAEGHHGNENVGEIIIHHISNDDKIDLRLVLPLKRLVGRNFHFGTVVHLPRIEFFGLDLSITKHVVMMLTAAVLLVVVLSFAARRRRPDQVPTGFAAAIETVVEFIRNQIAIPNMGEKLGPAFTSYLCTVFFFILTCNLLGLIPYGATATGNVNVTAALAALTFILTQAMAIKAHGIGGYFRHLTGGVHPAMWIIMIPVEFLGLFTKPFALCIRLYANMTAGHIVLLSLISLIFIMGQNGASPLAGIAIAPVSVAFSLFVNVLELFVALLQAYIFTLLSSLFIGLAAAHVEHHEETPEAHH
jgi:F-type H+-transporting ATPase subunit a